MKEIKKEEIENLSYKDITYMLLSNEKKGINTLDLFTKIITTLELPTSTIENKIGDYYTSLTTDKRFILVDGLWDLRSRHTSDKVIMDIEEEEEEEIELDENKEEDLTVEDEYDDEYTDDARDPDEFDDTDDDDLADLVVIDEEDLNE